MAPSWKSDFAEITVPYIQKLGEHQTLVILQRVWNKQVFNKDYIKSDIIDVDIFSAKYPISFDGKVRNTKLEIAEIQSSI